MALYLWASSLYEQKTVVTAGDVVATVPLAGGGEVQVAAQTTLTAVVRSAAPVSRELSLPDEFSSRPADGTVVGTAVYRADGVELGAVRLVVVTPAPPSPPETPAPEPTAPHRRRPRRRLPRPSEPRRRPLTVVVVPEVEYVAWCSASCAPRYEITYATRRPTARAPRGRGPELALRPALSVA